MTFGDFAIESSTDLNVNMIFVLVTVRLLVRYGTLAMWAAFLVEVRRRIIPETWYRRTHRLHEYQSERCQTLICKTREISSLPKHHVLTNGRIYDLQMQTS